MKPGAMPLHPADSSNPPTAARDQPAATAVHAPIKDLEGARQALRELRVSDTVAFLRGFQPASTAEAIEQATLLAGLGQFPSAQSALESALENEQDPAQRVEILRVAAVVSYRAEKWLQADRLASQVLDEIPDDPQMLGIRIALSDHLATPNAADRQAAIDFLYNFYDSGQADNAIELLAVARAALAGGSTAHYQDANLALSQAVEAGDFGQWQRLDDPRIAQAIILSARYNHVEAEELLAQIVAEQPTHLQARELQAQLYLARFQLARAADLAKLITSQYPTSRAARSVLAQVHAIEGDFQAARDELERIDVQDSTDAAVIAAMRMSEQSATVPIHAPEGLGDADGISYYRVLSDVLIGLHRYRQADVVLAAAAANFPASADLQSAYGLNLLRLGQETPGRAAIELAWSRDHFNERTYYTRKLFREVIDPLYVDIEVGNTKVRIPAASTTWLAPVVSAWIAHAKTSLTSAYGFEPEIDHIELYEQASSFSIRTTGVPDLGALGVCFGPVITTIGPFHGTHNAYAVLWHEIAHSYALALSHQKVPRWFTEGLSEWEAEQANPAWRRRGASSLLQAQRSGGLPTLAAMEQSFLRAGSASEMELAYTVASYLVRYLAENYGRQAILRFLEGFSESRSFAELCPTIIGKPVDIFENQFLLWLSNDLKIRVRGWQPSNAPEDSLRRELLERSHQAAAQSNYKHARKLLAELENAGGEGEASQMLAARIELNEKHIDAARLHLVKALEFNTEALEAVAGLAQLAERADRPQEELHWLDTALQLDAMSLDPAARALFLAILFEDDELASRAAEQVLGVAPWHPLAVAAFNYRQVRAPYPSAQLTVDTNGSRRSADILATYALWANDSGNRSAAKAHYCAIKHGDAQELGPNVWAQLTKRLSAIAETKCPS